MPGSKLGSCFSKCVRADIYSRQFQHILFREKNTSFCLQPRQPKSLRYNASCVRISNFLYLFPKKAGIVWTKSKACLTCLISWLFAFGFTAPILAMVTYTHDPESPVCLTEVDNFWSKFYFIFIITVFFFIPIFILVVLYVYIARHLLPRPATHMLHQPEMERSAAEAREGGAVPEERTAEQVSGGVK